MKNIWKKFSKRTLTMLLAAVMLLSCFGAIPAMAAGPED